MKYAGVVVLYNPDNKVISNIKTYVNQISKLYAVDNSDKKNNAIVEELKTFSNIEYIDNGGNKGIAHAQNVGAKKAIKDGYNWLLTMDQDSSATENMITILKNYIENYDTSNIGIVSAYQKNKLEKSSSFMTEYQQVIETMSSGNMLNLEVYKKVGKFKEKLFIDMVDYEYCLRLNKNGFKVIVANKAILNHNLGEIKIVDNTVIYKHHPIRTYYYMRNNLYVIKRYQKDFPVWTQERKKFIITIYIKNLLYDKHKLQYIFYMLRGYVDYCLNKYGKIGD